MSLAEELVNAHTARSLTRAVHAVLPGAELPASRAAARHPLAA
ncbi:hypothetical protein [Streptomyces sp. NPDC088766]